MTWQPLLTGAHGEAALNAARAIASALAEPPACVVTEQFSAGSIRVVNVSLGMGRAGVAVALGYLALADPEVPSHAASARKHIADAAQALGKEKMPPALQSGFTGIAWALARLRGWNIVRVDDSSLAAVDAALASYVDRDDWPFSLDVIGGLAGQLVYALARLPRPDAALCVERAVRIFERTAEELPDGISWFTPPAQLWGASLEKAPRGCYNVGIAHGTPGTVAVLSEVYASGIERTRVRKLVEEGVRWILAQEIAGTGNFPVMTGEDVVWKPSRMAWCYGSPGIPVVLLRAATALGREDWRDEAVRLALAAAARPFAEAEVIDPGFCHGAAGNGHLFNRLYQETGEARFADAARAWFDRALSMRVDGEGVAGFSSRPLPDGVAYPEPGLVYGAAGVAAALAAAASAVEPEWDAAFLLSRAGAAA
ncbi:MAG: lantibiotic biosynthesis protein [Acidobacteriota bacterium]|jgi:lantibiotic modifying enzyme|nr:lantibiotic biosynthesis protein [Acidobacteriota bacterium]